MICSLVVHWTGLFKEDMEKQIIQGADVLKNGCTILSQEGCREECLTLASLSALSGSRPASRAGFFLYIEHLEVSIRAFLVSRLVQASICSNGRLSR